MENLNPFNLSNSIRCIHQQVDTAEVSHFGITIRAGSRDETDDEQGLAHFIEHSIFKGTTARKPFHILSRLDAVGGELNAYTTKEETCIYGSFLNVYYERAIELIADIFSRIDKAERMASGLPRIMRLLSEAKLPEPVIESNSFFEITFKRDKRHRSATEYPEETTEELSARQVEILQALKDKKLAPSELIDALVNPVSPRTLRRELTVLKDKGYIDAEGAKGWARKWFLKK